MCTKFSSHGQGTAQTLIVDRINQKGPFAYSSSVFTAAGYVGLRGLFVTDSILYTSPYYHTTRDPRPRYPSGVRETQTRMPSSSNYPPQLEPQSLIVPDRSDRCSICTSTDSVYVFRRCAEGPAIIGRSVVASPTGVTMAQQRAVFLPTICREKVRAERDSSVTEIMFQVFFDRDRCSPSAKMGAKQRV